MVRFGYAPTVPAVLWATELCSTIQTELLIAEPAKRNHAAFVRTWPYWTQRQVARPIMSEIGSFSRRSGGVDFKLPGQLHLCRKNASAILASGKRFGCSLARS